MNKKRYLFVTMYFYPERDSSQKFLTDIKTELVKRGHEVTTMVPNPVRNLSQEVIKKYIQMPFEKTECGNIVRLYVNTDNSNGLVSRAKRFIGFQFKLKKYLKNNISNFDVVYFISNPPIFVPLMIEKVCKKNNVKTVFEVDDIFPEIIGKYGFLKPFAHKSIKNADQIITLSEDMKLTLLKWAKPTTRINLVNIWPSAFNFDISDMGKISSHFTDKFIVSYVGNIGHFQNIDLLLDVAKELKNNNNIKFIFAGFGRNVNHLQERITQENISNASYIGELTPEEALFAYSSSNLNIISLNKNVIKYAKPSKTSMVKLSNRRTLLIMDNSKYANELLKNDNFILDDTYDVTKIVKIINKEFINKIEPKKYSYDFTEDFNYWIKIVESISESAN